VIRSQRRPADLDHLLEQLDGLLDLPIRLVRKSAFVLRGQPIGVSFSQRRPFDPDHLLEQRHGLLMPA
jgi:hypothetical protein